MLELYHIGIKFRNEENVVDESEQDIGILLNLLHEYGFIGLVMFGFKQIGIAQNGCERGTYLVTHIGEERFFQEFSLLCLLRFNSQFFLCFQNIGHVTAHAEIAINLFVSIENRNQVEHQGYLALLFIAYLRFNRLVDVVASQMVHAIKGTGY